MMFPFSLSPSQWVNHHYCDMLLGFIRPPATEKRTFFLSAETFDLFSVPGPKLFGVFCHRGQKIRSRFGFIRSKKAHQDFVSFGLDKFRPKPGLAGNLVEPSFFHCKSKKRFLFSKNTKAHQLIGLALILNGNSPD